MIKQVLIVFFLLTGLSNLSAEISVKSFRKLENDMTARIDAPKKDQNGDVCAIIKVVTTQSGFIWEPDGLGIVSAENKGGEYWLYVPFGAKRLTIKHPQLGVLRDFMYNIPIEKATVYELVLTSGKVITTVEETIESQWLIIKSSQPNSNFYIDDQWKITANEYQAKLKPGKYNYRVEAPMHYPEAGVVEITDTKKILNVNLKPAFGYLSVTTDPEQGASVLIDGKPTSSVTPAKVDVASGEHTVQVFKEMYAPATEKVTVTDGQISSLNISLKPTFAELSVSVPSRAEVYVNGVQKGVGSWQSRLAPGIYSLEARLDKHTSAKQDIELAIGDKKTVDLQPTPIYGSLDIVTTPSEATVIIDGKSYGTTPLTINKLLVGNYAVQLIKSGYAQKDRNFVIVEGKTTEVKEIMENLTKGDLSVSRTKNDLLKDIQPKLDGKQPIQYNHFTEKANNVTFEMIEIKGGTFMMGNNDAGSYERPIHRVVLNDFYIAEAEVTQQLWEAVMGSNPSYSKGEYLPVENVSWEDCQKFITKLNQFTGRKYRLPSEAEWEYSANGNQQNRTLFLSGSNGANDVAWYSENSGSQTHIVKTKSSNEFGIYDMSGNVKEWCQDWYSAYDNENQINPKGPSYGNCRICRGGSSIDMTQECSITSRTFYLPKDHSREIGFRIALSSK